MKYLNKYNKTSPETWDELLETVKYIMKEEKKLNNTDIIGYKGEIEPNEIGTISIYEFIYSYRDSIDSPFPELTSQTAINALKKLKKIKEEISSAYLLPGNKKGVSGSFLGGYNIGINSYSKIEKKESAIEVLKFFTSKDMQEMMVKKFKYNSGILSIYEDEKLCSSYNCNTFKNIQHVGRPNTLTYDYDDYSEKFRNYIFEFLYGNKTAYEVLKRVNDITKIYYVSINGDNSM
eukprot:jgi/Orpsp1_1/1182855/evm.model.c7180000082928.1